MKLHLGVIDIPYREFKAGKAKKGSGGKTTGDVAEILESKYHIMESFYELHKREISRDMMASLQGAMESMMGGGPVASDPFIASMGKIETRFKRFLSDREMERIGYPGVPTAAALAGVNHRLKHPFAKANPRRPSFIDTGQYSAAMKAWVE